MFETAELGRKLSRRAYKHAEAGLREELLGLQKELLELDHSQVIVVFAGVDGAGKGQTVSLLNEWMDPRWLLTRAFDAPADVELERPEFWRYWLSLPPRGRIGLYLSSWYSRPVLDAVYGDRGPDALDRALTRIASFESALAADNAVILKFWMHLGREAQQARIERGAEDPLTEYCHHRSRSEASDWTGSIPLAPLQTSSTLGYAPTPVPRRGASSRARTPAIAPSPWARCSATPCAAAWRRCACRCGSPGRCARRPPRTRASGARRCRRPAARRRRRRCRT